MSTLDQLASPPKPQPTKEPKKVSGVDVVPYNGNFDKDADKFLPWFWNRLKADGLIGLYYPEGAETSFCSFAKLFSGNTNIAVVVVRDDNGEIVDAMGFATLELMPFGMAMAAHAGFIFLKEYWDHHTSDNAAHQIMRFWFESQNPRLDVVIGIVADANILAKRFLRRIGWAHSGDIPMVHQYASKQSDASIWYMTRQAFEAKG